MMNTERVLIILRGIPGAGKTTVAKYLTRNEGASVAADDYFTDRETGEYRFDPSKLGEAHNFCQKAVALYMKDGVSPLVVHNTSTTERELKPYFQMAKEHGYTVFSLVVENRHGHKDVHEVPQDAIERMVNRFSIKLV